MVKVIYTNGTEAVFNSSAFQHNTEHRMFFVETPGRNRIMIPDHCVACIGIYDEKCNNFE